MHLYGISYGTTVFSTYATIFPTFTGMMVLDSCAPPDPDGYGQVISGAKGMNDRIDYIIYSCSARNIQEPGSCPVEDMRQCFGDINNVLIDGGFVPGVETQPILKTFLLVMFNNVERAQEICDAAAEGNEEKLFELYEELTPSLDGPAESRQFDGYDPRSKPTYETDVYDNPEYEILSGFGQVPLLMVNAQDRSGPIYDEDRFAMETIEANAKYTGAGTGAPGSYFFAEYITSFYWPKATPLPPAGNPFITGKEKMNAKQYCVLFRVVIMEYNTNAFGTKRHTNSAFLSFVASTAIY